MRRTIWFIKFALMMSILLSTSNVIIEKSSLNNKQVMIVGTVIGLNLKEDSSFFDEMRNGKVQTSKRNIGIMTCIDLDTNKYVALGHPITSSNKIIDINDGECYNTEIISVDKAENYRSGSINAVINSQVQYGDIIENTDNGIYGNITNKSEFLEEKNQIYSIASRTQIQKGKAQIYINLDGRELKSYDVEITRINFWNKEQNLNIKVTDEDLIDTTGGILRGMSGTPIIQNGKLIGAINYVSEANPIDAYAIFADKLFK